MDTVHGVLMNDVVKCWRCRGTGQMVLSVIDPDVYNGPSRGKLYKCSTCKGTGVKKRSGGWKKKKVQA